MNKFVKTLGIIGMAAISAATITSCDGGSNSTPKIIIGCYMNRGNTYEALGNYLDSIKDDLNFEYERVLISSSDANANLTTFTNALETGADAIITMMDNNAENTQAILEKCEASGAYFAGWQTDFNNSRGVSRIVNSDYFLGAATDGDLDGAPLGEYFFNLIAESDKRNIVLARSPQYAYPTGKQSTDRFKELADEWNESHPDDQINVIYANKDAGSDDYSRDMGFSGNLDSALLDSWHDAGCDAIVAVNSLAARITNTLTTKSYKNDISVYTVGWDEGVLNLFGEDNMIKTLGQSPVETIVYPLIMCLNAINGTQFSDVPASGADGTGKFVIGQRVMVQSLADIQAGYKNCMIYSDNMNYSADKALISGEDLVAYLGSSEGSSWAKLKALIDSWDSEYVLYRK